MLVFTLHGDFFAHLERNAIIFFAKGVHYNLSKLASIGADVLGLDWTMDLEKVRKEIKPLTSITQAIQDHSFDNY